MPGTIIRPLASPLRGRRRKLRRSTYFLYVVERNQFILCRTVEPLRGSFSTSYTPSGRSGRTFELYTDTINRKASQFGEAFPFMARPARFERATAWFVARYSIQLSYGRVFLSEAGLSRCCRYVSINGGERGRSALPCALTTPAHPCALGFSLYSNHRGFK